MSDELQTQQTEIWMLDTDESPATLIKIGNVTGLGEFGPQGNDIDTTNLDSTAMEKIAGLGDNGDVTLNINVADQAAHRRLLDAVNSAVKTRYPFAIGYSDGTNDPTAGASDSITIGTGRTFDTFLASVKTFRKSIEINSIVKGTVALVVSGAITTTWKSENP